MTPERTFWLSQAGLIGGNTLTFLGAGDSALVTWKLVVGTGLGLLSLVCVGYAVQERDEDVPEWFREWVGWQRLALVSGVGVFVCGVLAVLFS
ncbi:hypothetical protein ACH9L7_05980 [Haloferax sp. S1W]|uniref:hypothetical protein n=1 Tax=Haloferax sp. S1W TaxID=3377110 RepID=UPI0037CA3500